MEKFFLSFKTPEQVLFKGEVASVRIKTEEGILEIHPKHATLVGSVLASEVRITLPNNDQEVFLARDGFLTFNNVLNEAEIVVLWGKPEAKVDKKTIVEYFDFLKKELENSENLNPYQLQYLHKESYSSEQLISLVEEK